MLHQASKLFQVIVSSSQIEPSEWTDRCIQPGHLASAIHRGLDALPLAVMIVELARSAWNQIIITTSCGHGLNDLRVQLVLIAACVRCPPASTAPFRATLCHS